MPKMKRKSRAKEPVRDGSQAEAWIRATHAAIRGVNLILHAMFNQPRSGQTQRRRTMRALKSFEDAANWIRISHYLPVTGNASPGAKKIDPRRSSGDGHHGA